MLFVTKQKVKFNVMPFIPFLICVHSLPISLLASTLRRPEVRVLLPDCTRVFVSMAISPV